VTKTQIIFGNDCPYNNASQTQAARLLFVCSVGMLRSPTAAVAATVRGHNARSCGSDLKLALIPLTVNLINWADTIFFMHQENFGESLKNFAACEYDEDIRAKAIVWNFEDNVNWGDQILFNTVTDKLAGMGL
jgi:predicted protein tyrosine phosphatase